MVVVERDDAQKVVIVTRLPGTSSPEELIATWGEIDALLDLPQKTYAIVWDVRRATGNNSPAFEAAVGQINQRMLQRFRRLVVILGTAVGVLQAKRLRGARTTDELVFARDLDEAIALASE
jgi:hypothetical protein